MEPENNQNHEVESVNSSASAGGGVHQDVTEGLYRLKNKKARTLLDLGGGTPTPTDIIADSIYRLLDRERQVARCLSGLAA